MGSIRLGGGIRAGRAVNLRPLRFRPLTWKMFPRGHCWGPPSLRRIMWASSLSSEWVMRRTTYEHPGSSIHRHVLSCCTVRAMVSLNMAIRNEQSPRASTKLSRAVSHRDQLQWGAKSGMGAATLRTFRCRCCKSTALSTMMRQLGGTRSRISRGIRYLVSIRSRSETPRYE